MRNQRKRGLRFSFPLLSLFPFVAFVAVSVFTWSNTLCFLATGLSDNRPDLGNRDSINSTINAVSGILRVAMNSSFAQYDVLLRIFHRSRFLLLDDQSYKIVLFFFKATPPVRNGFDSIWSPSWLSLTISRFGRNFEVISYPGTSYWTDRG